LCSRMKSRVPGRARRRRPALVMMVVDQPVVASKANRLSTVAAISKAPL
jgi:hypothetical protein